MKKTTKSGFTLVELSIVLVIIGLLIGGILVGQSLIESAKMQSFIRQVGQYDAAVGVFKDKFGNLPGDNTLFGILPASCTSTCSLGDGVITSATGNVAAFNTEIGSFWADLSASGLKSEDNLASFAAVRDTATTPPVLGNHVPQSKIGTNAGILAYGVGGKNYYYVGSNTANTFAFGTGSIKPADALAIDSKIDDGIPNTGTVMPVNSGVTVLPVAADYTTPANLSTGFSATNCYLTATTYNAAYATDTCKVSIRMGSSTGVLQ